MKPKCIILDIDGVILNSGFIMQEILELGLKGNEKWNYFYENCNSDRVILMPCIKEFQSELCCDIKTVISTARNERCRKETAMKLTKHKIFFDRMYMRKENDFRDAHEVKKDHLIMIMKRYDVISFIDDDIYNCEMARDMGILALRRV